MGNDVQSAAPPVPPKRKSRWRWAWRVLPLVALAVLGYWWFGGAGDDGSTAATVPVRRGPLSITVLESGSFEALESQEVKSEVQGQTKILSIVEEGYEVTPQDVADGKILAELDSKELVDRQIAQELEYQSAYAAYAEAKGEYDIQINQNESDIMTAELAAKFARMDFEKYMGVNAAPEILTKMGINELPQEPPPEPPNPADAEPQTASDAEQKPAGDNVAEDADKAGVNPQHMDIDFSKYVDTALLADGEARQKLRKCEDDQILSMKELGLSKTQFDGTQRLSEKGFVTTNDLENERLRVERNEVNRQAMETAKDLFIKYEFPKEAETRLSTYIEALRKLTRARKLAVSKMAQADAKLKATEKRHSLQKIRRDEIQEQIDKCKIKAERPGMVVYANDDPWHGSDRIQEGAMVRERQKIITIPDMSQMVVKVKVHEASIKSVQKGQKARVRVDAYPDEVLTGEVYKVGVLPDSQNRWMNPDLKVYETTITINGTHDWVKPGMSAQAEIIVKDLPDALYVPIQAVTPSDGEKVCYVAAFGGPERRVVEVGDFNNEFIEIKGGLKEDEEVLLRAPVVPEQIEKTGGGDRVAGDEAKGEEEKKGKGPTANAREGGQAVTGNGARVERGKRREGP